MKIDKLVSQLNEAVKKRQGSFRKAPIGILHPDFPVKGITRKDLEATKKIIAASPYPHMEYETPVFKKLFTTGKYRATVRGSYPLKYYFKPEIGERWHTLAFANPEKLRAPRYTEAGEHAYEFKTKNDELGEVHINHREAPKGLQRRGIRTTSDINFSVGGSTYKTGSAGTEAVSIFRSVLPAIRHHIRSHNPDQITFKSYTDQSSGDFKRTKGGDLIDTRKKLYDSLVKRLSKTHNVEIKNYESGEKDEGDLSSDTEYILTRKKSNDASLRNAMKMLAKERNEARKQLKKQKLKEGKEEEWNAKYDQLSDRGGLSHEQIIRQIGEKPSSPQPEQAPPTRTLTGIELLRQRAKKAAEIALKRKQSGD
jgi:hypothetical protein